MFGQLTYSGAYSSCWLSESPIAAAIKTTTYCKRIKILAIISYFNFKNKKEQRLFKTKKIKQVIGVEMRSN